MRARAWALGALVFGLAAWGPCGPSTRRDMIERVSPVPTPPGGYRILAYVSGGTLPTDFQISNTVRQQMEDSGFTMLRRAGRWGDEREAMRAICAPDVIPVVHGVLFIRYNQLELRDCASEGVVYDVKSAPTKGITDMTARLVAYLRRPAPAATGQSPPQ